MQKFYSYFRFLSVSANRFYFNIILHAQYLGHVCFVDLWLDLTIVSSFLFLLSRKSNKNI